MYFYASLFIAFVITLFVVSKVAKMLLAKRPNITWVFLASLIGISAAIVVFLSLYIFVSGVDPMVMLITSLSTMFIVSSGAFKYINKMSWTSAITTNVAHIALVLITLTAAVVLNGRSMDETLSVVSTTAKEYISVVGLASGHKDTIIIDNSDLIAIDSELGANQSADQSLINNTVLAEEPIVENEVDDGLEVLITERDLLSPSTLRALKGSEKQTFVEPKYRIISIASIHSVVGQPIRILRKNGKVVAGSLKKINGSDAYVAQRLRTGVATTPIAIAKIRKLEVYR
ncbi:MAG: hypothetical protein V3U64_05120 [Cocleimonas sp.]